MADSFTNSAEERPADRKPLLLDHFPRSTMNPIAQKLNPAPAKLIFAGAQSLSPVIQSPTFSQPREEGGN
jgi:hypothetical protein